MAKPAVFTLFCGFCGSGIQEQLEGVLVEGLAWGHGHMLMGSASHLKAWRELQDLLQGGSFTCLVGWCLCSWNDSGLLPRWTFEIEIDSQVVAISFYDLALEITNTLCFRKGHSKERRTRSLFFFFKECQRMCTHNIKTTAVIEKRQEQKQELPRSGFPVVFPAAAFTHLSWPGQTVLIASLLFSCSVMSRCLQPYGLQHARLPCPSLSSGVYLDSHPLSWWCCLTVLPSATHFSFCLQSFPASGSFLALHIRWPRYWSFSFSINPSHEYSGLISFRIDWFDLLAV